MEDIKVRFGNKIKELRKSMNMSQENFSSKSKLHRTYISDIERGLKNVSLENIEKLANALDIEIFKLFK